MSLNVFDPTVEQEEEEIRFAPRPARLEGLRVGLVDNTKYNANVILKRVAKLLEERHGMRTTHMDVKVSPAHTVEGPAIATLRERADFVIAGVGD